MKRFLLWSLALCAVAASTAYGQDKPGPVTLPDLKFDFDFWDLVVLGGTAGGAIALVQLGHTYFFGGSSNIEVTANPPTYKQRLIVVNPSDANESEERIVDLPYLLDIGMEVNLCNEVDGTVASIQHIIDPDDGDGCIYATFELDGSTENAKAELYKKIHAHSDWTTT